MSEAVSIEPGSVRVRVLLQAYTRIGRDWEGLFLHSEFWRLYCNESPGASLVDGPRRFALGPDRLFLVPPRFQGRTHVAGWPTFGSRRRPHRCRTCFVRNRWRAWQERSPRLAALQPWMASRLDQDLSVATLARQSGYSTDHFRRIFFSVFGTNRPPTCPIFARRKQPAACSTPTKVSSRSPRAPGLWTATTSAVSFAATPASPPPLNAKTA